jgi:alpha-L-fucosidase
MPTRLARVLFCGGIAFLCGSALIAQTTPDVPAKVREVETVAARGPFAPNWDSLGRYQVPDWYQDAKFGIFIHWGVYSVPAFGNEWYPRNMYKRDEKEFAHHVATHGPQSQFGYKDFIPRFTGEHFDAARWAALFKAAGARYIVPVAEHP